MTLLYYINYPSWLHPEVIPGFFVRWYAVMYLVGLGITYVLFMKLIRADKYSITKEVASDYIFYIMIGLILGARIFSTLFYEIADTYRRAPWLIFWPFRNGQFTGFQGMSYHGGVVGGVTAALIYTKIKKLDFLDLADYLCTALPLGYTFGRLGNFNLPRHPSQLYEAFFEGVFLWFIMWFILRKIKPFKGFMLSMYLVLFGFFRFCVEYFRQP
ncbi:MAG: prolipoprotein diacylglyceryl transferase, partial [Spirochaetaceae bacterium 4572_7]